MTVKNRLTATLGPALVLAAVFSAHPARAQEAPSADSLGAYELSEVEVMPQLSNRSAVASELQRQYPRELRRRRETGAVTLRFVVRPDGKVDSTHISVENSANEGFNEAAVKVVRTMRFTPARLGGQQVAVWATLPVMFWLEPRSAPTTRAPGDARPPRE